MTDGFQQTGGYRRVTKVVKPPSRFRNIGPLMKKVAFFDRPAGIATRLSRTEMAVRGTRGSAARIRPPNANLAITMTQHSTSKQGADRSALVLFSGGQDSTTCLAWALERFERVETLGFDYDQRHRVELQIRPQVLQRMRAISDLWAQRLGEDHLIDLGVLGNISDTALTRDTQIRLNADGLPNTFVPGRNLVFLTLAAALGYRRGISVLVAGMCETDYSGYPDCRDKTLRLLEQAVSLGMDRSYTFETPLMWLTKAQTWALAAQLGGPALIDTLIRDTHTCYLGDRSRLHAWGYGCGQCPACQLRRAGYEEWTHT